MIFLIVQPIFTELKEINKFKSQSFIHPKFLLHFFCALFLFSWYTSEAYKLSDGLLQSHTLSTPGPVLLWRFRVPCIFPRLYTTATIAKGNKSRRSPCPACCRLVGESRTRPAGPTPGSTAGRSADSPSALYFSCLVFITRCWIEGPEFFFFFFFNPVYKPELTTFSKLLFQSPDVLLE